MPATLLDVDPSRTEIALDTDTSGVRRRSRLTRTVIELDLDSPAEPAPAVIRPVTGDSPTGPVPKSQPEAMDEATMLATAGRLSFMSRLTRPQEETDTFHLSFSDLMSLLLVFFVVLFSMTMGRAKPVVKQVGQSIALPSARTSGKDLPQLGAKGKGNRPDPLAFAAAGTSDGLVADAFNSRRWASKRVAVEKRAVETSLIGTGGPAESKKTGDRVSRLMKRLGALSSLSGRRGDVKVYRDQHSLVVSMASRISFATGTARLLSQARPVLDRLSRIIRSAGVHVQIKGHADARPIKSSKYPSNWELSAARAASVARYLAAKGVSPQMMTIHGHGSSRPVGPNTSAAGRARNRRVEIRLSAEPMV